MWEGKREKDVDESEPDVSPPSLVGKEPRLRIADAK